MVDVFGEVDEQLRADRLRAFMKRAIPVFIAALVLSILAVVGVWGVETYQKNQSAKASEAYQAALDLAAKGDDAKAFDQFAALAAKSGPYKPLALMQQGAIRMDQNKPAEAAALFDQAAGASKTPLVSDIATLKAAYALMDTAPLQQLVDKLTPLTQAGRPYQGLAREALAMAKLAAGKPADAKADLVALSLLQDTPDTARQRAQAIIALIDSGTGAGLKKLADEAKTAVPTPIQPPPQAAGPEGAPVQVQPEAAQ